MQYNGWDKFFIKEFEKSYFKALREFLEKEYASETIYPKKTDILNTFLQTSFEEVSVVILGQDPYHGENQAHGLSFSVPINMTIPPSLKNIFKEISQEFGKNTPKSGDLTHWASQGVLLLNAVLTVRANQANSHANKGWEQFTDAIIKEISDKKNNIVFMLWGSYAQKKELLIDNKKHLILKSSHPSPLSAHRGFMGCGHFLAANKYLVANEKKMIEWI